MNLINLNNKKIILVLAAIIGMIPVIVYKCTQTNSITPNLLTTIQFNKKGNNDCYTNIEPIAINGDEKTYRAWLQQKEVEVWQNVEKLTGISCKQCKALVAEYQKEHDAETTAIRKELKLDKEVAPAIKAVIDPVIQDLGCQPLEIISTEYPVAAVTHGPVVLVNEEIFNTMSTLAQKFVVAHEIMHILLQDDEMRFVLRSKGFITNDDSLDYAMNQLYRFQELRADILAALTNADYAQGYNEYVHNALSRRDETEITELFYPTYALRQTASEKIQQLHI